MISFALTPSYFVNRDIASLEIAEVSDDIEVTVYPKWFREVTLEWSVPAEWGEVSFAVYRSASSETGFEKVNSSQIKGNTWVDRETFQDSTHRKDYYIVEATLATGAIIRSPVSFLKGTRTPVIEVRAKEISRRESFMLKRYMGVPTILFKRMTYGRRCSNCWSDKYKKITKANCEVCAGSGFEGGFFPGTLSYFQFEPSQKNLQFTHFGKLESNQTSCWTTSLPRLDPHDVVIRLSDFRVFNVDHVRQTELQSVTVRQIAALTEISHDSPIYSLIDKYELMSDAIDMAGFSIPSDEGGFSAESGTVIGGLSANLD